VVADEQGRAWEFVSAPNVFQIAHRAADPN